MIITNPKFIISRKFFTHLTPLSITELRDFHHFAQSPFLKLAATELAILTAALPYHPKYDITEKKLLAQAKKIADNKPQRLNFYLYRLTEVLEKWLRWQKVEQDEVLQQQLLAKAYRARKQQPIFFKESEKTVELLSKQPQQPVTFLALYQVNAGIFYHHQTPKFKAEVISLSEMEKYLDLFYQGVKLRLFCQKLSRSAFLKTAVENNAAQEWLAFAEQQQHLPFFKLYYNLIRYRTQPTDDSRQRMITDFKTLNLQLDRFERIICVGLMINAITAEGIAENKQLQEIQFDLLQYTFAQDIAIYDGVIRDGLFNNYVMVACFLGKFKAATEFIKKYESYLDYSSRADLVTLLKCTILYYQGRLEEVKIQLNQLKFKSFGINVRVKNLYAKCLYELYEEDEHCKGLVQSHLQGFKIFIKRQKDLQPTRKQPYFNLIKVMRLMVRGVHKKKYQKTPIKIELLELVTDDTFPLISRPWLRQKIEQWD